MDSNNNKDTVDVFGEGDALVDRWVIDENEYKPVCDTVNVEETAFDDDGGDEDDDDALFFDEKGFQLVTMSRWDKQRKVRSKLNEIEEMTHNEASNVSDPWKLSIKQRWR